VTAEEAFVPNTGVWVRRAGVLSLVAVAGLLILGPSTGVLTKFVGPALFLIAQRSFRRSLMDLPRYAQHKRKRMSKRGYAITATVIVGLLSLPLWLLCNKVLIAITLVPALICIWFAVYLFRGT